MGSAGARNLGPLESLRAVAALMIVVFHLVEMLKLPAPPGIEFISSHFGLGVPLFFALSGFVLSYGYSERVGNRQEIFYFYSRRFFRIAPLFYFMLLLWCITNAWVFNNYFSVQTIFLNVFFLFALVPGLHEGIVWASWSIGVEMLFYLVFPVVVLVGANVRSAACVWLVSLVLSAHIFSSYVDAGMNSFAYMNLGQQLPFFFSGVVAFRIWQRFDFFRNEIVSVSLVAAALAAAAFMTLNEGVYVSLWKIHFGRLEHNIWSVVFGVLILGSACGEGRIISARPMRNLGKVSFSVYLVHPLLMLGMKKLGFVDQIKGLGLGLWGQFGLGLLLVVITIWAVSNVTYRVVERGGEALGQRFTKRFLGPQPDRAARSGA